MWGREPWCAVGGDVKWYIQMCVFQRKAKWVRWEITALRSVGGKADEVRAEPVFKTEDDLIKCITFPQVRVATYVLQTVTPRITEVEQLAEGHPTEN